MPRCAFVLLFLLTGLPIAASDLEVVARNVEVAQVNYQGRDALRVTESERSTAEDKVAILIDQQMQNGTISGYVMGELRKDARAQARGFVGIAFRINDDVSSFESVYLRPTNARAEDQLRRNHSIQYFSYPDYPWHRLRKDAPAKYESYADMVPGEWIHYRLQVEDTRARLFLNHAEQPVLIVNDLKLGTRPGKVGLWVGPGTVAHFAEIQVDPR